MNRISNTMNAYMRLNNHRFKNLMSELTENNNKIYGKMTDMIDIINTNFHTFSWKWQLYKAFQVQLSHVFLTTFDLYRYNLQLMISA